MPWLKQLPAEQRAAALGAFFTLAGIMAGHAFLETARDALFLASLPAAHLPWMYLGIAAGAFLVTGAHRWTRRYDSRFVLSVLLVISGLVTLGFWAFSARLGPRAFYALYIWTGLYASTLVVQFWMVTSESYTITQAKRVYGFIGAGGVVGALGGAAAARALTAWFEPRHLLFAAFVTLTVAGLAPLLGLRRLDLEPRAAAGSERTSRPIELCGLIRRDPYLLRLALLVLVSTTAITGVDYLFKSAVARSIEPDEMGTFFATVNIGLNVLALAAQVLVVPLALRKVGVSRALAVLPVFLVLGSAGLAAGGGLVAALILIGAQDGLRHTLHRTGTELLYVPIAREARLRAKAFIDGSGRRFAQALGSLGILALVATPRSDTILALAVLGLALLWIAVALSLQPHYLHIFRSNLSKGAIQTRVDLPPLDLESLEALIAALNSGDDSEVLAALELIRDERKLRLVPGLILYHPSSAVVLRALELFEEVDREDLLDIAERLSLHADPEVRAAALRLRTSRAPDESVLRAGLNDESPAVRATALIGLLAGGWTSEAQARDALGQMAREGPTEARVAIVQAVRRRREVCPSEILAGLAGAPEREVREAVAEAMGETGYPQFLPYLRDMLAERDVRATARAALVAMDLVALEFLTEALADTSLPHEVRRHVPRTISRFRPSLAAPILIDRLREEPDGLVRFKILRGLGTLRADNPALRLDAQALRQATKRNIAGAYRLIDWRLSLQRGAESMAHAPGGALLVALLRDKEKQTLDRLFRLLGLQFPGEDFGRIHRGLQSEDRRVRASARELVENTLSPSLRKAVLGLIDEVPDRQRLAHAPPYHVPELLDEQSVVRALLERGGESLQCLAAYYVGERGLSELRPSLESLSFSRASSRLVTEVVTTALGLLEQTDMEKAERVALR